MAEEKEGQKETQIISRFFRSLRNKAHTAFFSSQGIMENG